MIFLQGDWVEDVIQNRIGLVRRVNDKDESLYVWYHTGGTASKTPMYMVERVDKPSMFKTYSNHYAIASLEERRVRLLSGFGDYSDLIEGSQIRPAIRRKYGLM